MSKTLKIIIAATIAIMLTAGLLYVKLRKEQGPASVNTNVVNSDVDVSVSEPEIVPVSDQEILDALSAPATERSNAIDELSGAAIDQPEVSEQEIIDALSAPAIERSKAVDELSGSVIEQPEISEQEILDALSAPAKN
jgi:hypothetical protein